MRHLHALLLVFACASYGREAQSVSFIGTVINSTNPDKPVASPIQMTMGPADAD